VLYVTFAQLAESCGAFIVTQVSIRLALEGLGFWVMEQLDDLDGSEICSVLGSVGKLFVTASDGILRMVWERDESNLVTDELPPSVAARAVPNWYEGIR
jgi:hypothetical protein